MQAEAKLREVRLVILKLTTDLQQASDEEMPRITRELQRQRVAFLILREIAHDLSDPTTRQELTLLTKMNDRVEEEDPALKAAQDEEAEAARQRMSAIGLDPEQASSIVRVFEALQKAANANPSTYGSNTSTPPVQ